MTIPAPRVRDSVQPSKSKVLPSYQRQSRLVKELIFRLIVNAQKRWRRLNAPVLVAKVIRGVRYENGQETTTAKKSRKKVAA